MLTEVRICMLKVVELQNDLEYVSIALLQELLQWHSGQAFKLRIFSILWQWQANKRARRLFNNLPIQT